MIKTQTLVVNEALLVELKQQLQARWDLNDFRYPTLSHYIQAAFEDYRQGIVSLPATNLNLTGQRKTISVCLTAEQRSFYQKLPRGKKGLIIDKVLSAYRSRIC